jgi:hypothetical protein
MTLAGKLLEIPGGAAARQGVPRAAVQSRSGIRGLEANVKYDRGAGRATGYRRCDGQTTG